MGVIFTLTMLESPTRRRETRDEVQTSFPINGRIRSSLPPPENPVRQAPCPSPTPTPFPFQPTFPQPDRVTFTVPFRCLGSPLDRYKASASKALEPDPYRFVQAKLGLSAAEFDQRVTNDIDKLLTEIEHNIRQELLEQMSFERVLSKEDCFRMLSRQQHTTGSMLGMYLWAADLGTAHYNFDFDWERDDINILNAYTP